MISQWTQATLLIGTAFVLISCGPKPQEETVPPEQQQMMPLKKPAETLTPQQKQELEINEENVMEPVPG